MDSSITFVTRQTNYSRSVAKARLEEHGGDAKKVVRAYLRDGKAKDELEAAVSDNATDVVFRKIRNEFIEQDTRPADMGIVAKNLEEMEERKNDARRALDALNK